MPDPIRTRWVMLVCCMSLSLVASVGLGRWSVVNSFAGRPFNGSWLSLPGTWRGYDSATAWNGSVWYACLPDGPIGIGKESLYEIRRRDLRTGEEHLTPLSVLSKSPPSLIAARDAFWILANGTRLLETNGEAILREIPFPFDANAPRELYADVIPIGGIWTTVVPFAPGRFRLITFREDRWQDGPEVILPDPSQRWIYDEQRNEKRLAPRTVFVLPDPTASSTPPGLAPMLFLRESKNCVHLVMLEFVGKPVAYREGFEFVETSNEAASALIPINAPPEPSDWKLIVEKDRYFAFATAATSENLYVLAGTPHPSDPNQPGPQVVFKRMADGRFVEYLTASTSGSGFRRVWADPTTGQVFVVPLQVMGAAEVLELIEGRLVSRVWLPGHQSPFLWWYVRLIATVVGCLLIHAIITFTVVAYYRRWSKRDTWAGNGDAHIPRPASPVLRAIAGLIDLFWILLPITVQIAINTRNVDWLMFLEDWWQIECRFMGFPRNNWQSNYHLLIRNNLHLVTRSYASLQWAILGSLVLWGLKVVVEGRTGITPGNWLAKLRTMGMDARPCGVARAIVRDVLLCLDIPLFITPLPAALSMALTVRCQRLGDLLADTMVISTTSADYRAGAGRVANDTPSTTHHFHRESGTTGPTPDLESP